MKLTVQKVSELIILIPFHITSKKDNCKNFWKKPFGFSTYWLTCCIRKKTYMNPNAKRNVKAFNASARTQNDCSCRIPLVLLYIKRKYEKILANILSIMQLKTKRKQALENERKHQELDRKPGTWLWSQSWSGGNGFPGSGFSGMLLCCRMGK